MTEYAEPQARGSAYFTDDDDAQATTKREDEVLKLAIDWSDALNSGETISSAAYDDTGITRTSTSNTTTTTTTFVAGLGETEITLTLSTGRVLQRVYRWYAPEARSVRRDYR